jgi:plastocyanin
MHRSRISLAIFAALCALALAGAGCGKEKKSKRQEGAAKTTTPDTPPTTPDTPPTTPDTPPTTPAGGSGTIAGSVAFTGTAPAMPKLKREADPFCAKTEMNDETVVVNGNGTLANVLVRIKPGSAKGAAAAGPVTVKQDNCMYRPRVQGAQTGQEVVIGNGDPTTHNVHAFGLLAGEGEESLYNLAQPKGAADITKDVGEYDVVKFKCDVHPWMYGYVVVTDHPFFAVTSDTGEFKIENVPAGKYTIEAWHEHFGMKTVEVEVTAGGSADPKLGYDGTEKG